MGFQELFELALDKGLPFALAGGGAYLFWNAYQGALTKYHALLESIAGDVIQHIKDNKDKESGTDD